MQISSLFMHAMCLCVRVCVCVCMCGLRVHDQKTYLHIDVLHKQKDILCVSFHFIPDVRELWNLVRCKITFFATVSSLCLLIN